MYIIADLVNSGSGWRPELPEGTSFLELAMPSNGRLGEPNVFALYKTPYLEKEDLRPSFKVVSDELHNLLSAAESYPPAMALARNAVQEVANNKEEFARFVADRLRFYLNGQRKCPYVMVEASRSETGYKSAGSYYWIVGLDTKRPRTYVYWVSRDFFVYQDKITDFNINEAWLRERFKSL